MPQTTYSKKHRGQNAKQAMFKRRQEVAHLYLDGKSQWAISEVVGVSHVTVSKDLKFLRDQWLAESKSDFDERKAWELAKINRLEELALEAWHRSCEDAEVCVKKVERALRDVEPIARPGGRGGVGSKMPKVADLLKAAAPVAKEMTVVKKVSEKTAKGQTGNPVFLQLVQSCIELRLKMFGMLQDVNVHNTVVNVGGGWDTFAAETETVGNVDSRLSAPLMLEPPIYKGSEQPGTVIIQDEQGNPL